MPKTIYCTLDTETVGGACAPTGMYNLGAVIHDADLNIIASVSYLVMEHYDAIARDDYAKRTFPLYQERISNGHLTAVVSEKEAVEALSNLCYFYGVKYVMAFNTGFDFCKTICRELLDEFEFIDIYLMALQTITHKKSYQKFCNEHKLFSKSGKSCATSAQAIYAYITGNPDYLEEHTAHSDAMIEMRIFHECRKMHKKYTKNCHQWNCKDFKSKCFPKIVNNV